MEESSQDRKNTVFKHQAGRVELSLRISPNKKYSNSNSK